MRTVSTIFFILTGVIPGFAESSADISPTAKRADTLSFARTLIAPVEPLEAIDPATLKNPFNPSAPPPSPAAENSAALVPAPNELALLEQIAPKVTPTGSVEIGGEALLLFGQKKLKVGDHLPIIFEGKPYELEIAGIQSTRFTLRLNGVEITRPIKSVTKP